MKIPRTSPLWDDSAEIYAVVAPEISFYQETADRIIKTSSLQPGMTVLDLASGSACLIARKILELVPGIEQIICVDSSERMISECKKHIHSEKVRFVHCAAEFVNKCIKDPIDVVICNSGIWHFDLDQSLPSIEAVLVRSGRFLFTISEWDMDFGAPLNNPKYWIIDDELHRRGLPPKPSRGSVKKLDPELLCLMLQRYGFKVIALNNFSVPVTSRDYRLFYQIPAIVQRSLPQLPLHLAHEVLSAAIDRLGNIALPPLKWSLFVTERMKHCHV